MKFWDSSALVPLLVEERWTAALASVYLQEDGLQEDGLQEDGVLVWWGTEIECVSAITRSQREGRITATAAALALERLESLALSWHRIEPADSLRQTAKRFWRVHPLRAADSLQLASAFQAAEGQPETLGFVCLDDRLVEAAHQEGFRVLDRRFLDSLSP